MADNLPKTTKPQREKLATLATAREKNEASYLPSRTLKPLTELGLIDVAPDGTPGATNTAGEKLVRISDTGLAVLKKYEGVAERVAPTAPEGGFEIVSGFTMPEPSRAGRREAVYPFDKLEIGQSFFIPATAENENPAKRLNGTVSSANRRYKDTTPPRYFRVAAVEHKGAKGAMVQRMEPPAKTA